MTTLSLKFIEHWPINSQDQWVQYAGTNQGLNSMLFGLKLNFYQHHWVFVKITIAHS